MPNAAPSEQAQAYAPDANAHPTAVIVLADGQVFTAMDLAPRAQPSPNFVLIQR